VRREAKRAPPDGYYFLLSPLSSLLSPSSFGQAHAEDVRLMLLERLAALVVVLPDDAAARTAGLDRFE